MKRPLAGALSSAVVAATLAGGALAGPARALDTSTPVYDGLPSGWAFSWVAHGSDEFGPGGFVEHMDGDAPTGWGTGSLKLQMFSVTEVRLTITRSLAGLTAASAWVRTGNVAVEPEAFDLVVEVDGTSYAGALPLEQAWTHVDLATLELTEAGVPAHQTTLLALAQAHPTTATVTFVANNGYDAGGAQAFVDGVSMTAGGTTEAYDFESLRTQVTCALEAAATTITAGGSVALHGSAHDDIGAPLLTTLNLFARSFGAPEPVQVDSQSTDFDGVAAFTARPTTATTYVVEHAQDATMGRCLSGAVTVQVKTKVTAAAADATVTKGARAVVTGATTPAKPGTAVTLWRLRPAGDVRLASGNVKANGRYRLTAPVTRRGTWRLQVRVAAGSGNLAGRSPAVPVTVS